MSGKGSAPRPFAVTQDEYASNWDRIFLGRSSTAEQPALTRPVAGSSPAAPATFIDDATGQVVDETWWPDATSNGRPPT